MQLDSLGLAAENNYVVSFQVSVKTTTQWCP